MAWLDKLFPVKK